MNSKRSDNFRKGATILILLLSINIVIKAQVGNFQISVRNITQTSPGKLEFDVYLLDTDPDQAFELASCQLGFLFNSQIYSGGTISAAINNTGSGLNSTQQFSASPSLVTGPAGYPNQTLLRLAGKSPPGAGKGTIISTSGNGSLLTHFIITSSVNFASNTTPDLIICASSVTSPLYATRVSVYDGTVNTALTVTLGSNAMINGNPVLNPQVPPPAAFNLTGGGTYCQGSGGLSVGVASSETSVTYTLYKGGLTTGQSQSGTGSVISFGNQSAGIYTVKGTSAGGTTDMSGSAVITENALPAITGTLSACAGSTTQLTGSGTPAVNNPWVSAATSVATVTNTGLIAGISEGTSAITYTDNNGCTKTASVKINALPAISGNLTVLAGSATQLTGSGTSALQNPWISATASVATVSNTGLVTGVSAGTSVITYTNSNFCSITATVTVNALPTLSSEIPENIFALNAFPNPFRDRLNIEYFLTENSDVRIIIYDINGKLIITLVKEKQQAGNYSVHWYTGSYPQGEYIIKIQAGVYQKASKVILIR